MRIIKIIILGEYHSNYASMYNVSISSTPYKSRLIIKNVHNNNNKYECTQYAATDRNNLQFVSHQYLCHHNIDIIIIIMTIIIIIMIIIININMIIIMIVTIIIIIIVMVIIITIIIIITSIMIITLIMTIY